MFDLESAIKGWRDRLLWKRSLSASDIREMESHLRDEIESHKDVGRSSRSAFFAAVRSFGDEETFASEFDQVSRRQRWTDAVMGFPALLGSQTKSAVRYLLRQKTSTAISLGGFTCSLTLLLVALAFVNRELSYDVFFEDSERIFRVVVDRVAPGDRLENRIHTPDALAAGMRQSIPEIDQAARFIPPIWGRVTLRAGDRSVHVDDYLATEPALFDVFSLEFIHGDPESAMRRPSSIVLTRSIAETLYGSSDILEASLSMGDEPVRVGAVVEDLPRNSHLSFRFLRALPSGGRDCWDALCGHSYTYFKLSKGTDVQVVTEKIRELVASHQSEERKDRYDLQPLTGWNSIHLTSRRHGELKPNGNRLSVGILLVGALVLVSIAGISHVNLMIAKSAVRSRETGVRKTMGAGRSVLFVQAMIESNALVFLSGGLSVVAAALAVPALEQLVGADLPVVESAGAWSFVALVLAVGIASGLYPGIVLSSASPLAALEKEGRLGSRLGLRRILVGVQLGLAVFFLICYQLMGRQISHIEAFDVGFDSDRIVILRNISAALSIGRAQVVSDALRDLPEVVSLGSTSEFVGLGEGEVGSWGSVRRLGTKEAVQVAASHIDHALLETLGIELIAGRGFTRGRERTVAQSIILNETAARTLGLTAGEVGSQVTDSAGRTSTLVGIVRDFNHSSLHSRIGPYAFFYHPGPFALAIRIREGDINASLEAIGNTWSRLVPDTPADILNLGEQMRFSYQSEDTAVLLISMLTWTSLVIVSLGTVGMVSYSAARRAKELSIRKVLGANVAQVTALLVREYVVITAISACFAIPTGWYVSDWLLREFAYKAATDLSTYLVSVITVLCITLATVCWVGRGVMARSPLDAMGTD